MTLPKEGLRTRPYSMDMNKDIATLPKKGLKTRPYNIGMENMEKKDLKKLIKGQLIKIAKANIGFRSMPGFHAP